MNKAFTIPDMTVRRLQEQMLEEQRSRKLAIRAGREWVRDHAKYPALVRLGRLADDLERGADICDYDLADIIAILVEPASEPDDVSQFWKDIAGEEVPDRVFLDGFLAGAMEAWSVIRERLVDVN